jgi:hypothetical protein
MTPEHLAEIREGLTRFSGYEPVQRIWAKKLLAEVDRQAAEIQAFRGAILLGDGPFCEDVCMRSCIGVCNEAWEDTDD